MTNSILQIFKSLNKFDRRKYVYFLLSKIIISALDLIGILFFGLLTAIAVGNFTGTSSTSFLGKYVPENIAKNLPLVAGIGLFFFLTKAFTAVWVGKKQANFFARVDTDVASNIVKFSMKNGLTELKKYTPDSWQWAVMESTSNAYSGVLMNLSVVISEGVLLFSIFVLFSVVNPIWTIIILLYFGIIFYGMQLTIGKLQHKYGELYSKGVTQSTNELRSIFSAFKEIDVLSKDDYFSEKFRQSRSIAAHSLSQSRFLMTMPRYVIETALMIGVVLFIGWQYGTGTLDSAIGSTVGIFLAGSLRMMGSAIPLQNSLSTLKSQIPQSAASMEIVSKFATSNKPSSNKNHYKGLVPEQLTALSVDISEVEYTFPGSTKSAVTNITFSVEPGKFTAIIGPSGAGKSTVADLILGLLLPTRGDIKVDGISVPQFISKYPGKISYVPQQPGMISGSILENIALGVPRNEIDYKQVNEVIKKAQLEPFISSLPDALETDIGKHADSLSGGQLQRIGLARALYSKPRLLVMDEATSALDAGTEALVTETLFKLVPEVSILVIAHRLSTVQHADKVVLMEEGKVTDSGTFNQLREKYPIVDEHSKLLSVDEEPQN